MSNPVSNEQIYRAWLVRMWPVCCDGQTIWRASVEDAHNGERHAFANLPALFTFLEEVTLSDQPAILEEGASR